MAEGPWPARYHDGRVAITHAVTVALHWRGLAISGENGTALALWPSELVRLIEIDLRGNRLRLGRTGGDERLTLPADALAPIEAACRALHRPGQDEMGWRGIALWTVAAVGAVLLLLFVIIPFVARESVHWASPAMEAELGQRTEKMVIAMIGAQRSRGSGTAICQDAKGRAALARMIAPLIAQLRVARPPVVDVIDSKMVNAIALPGGQVLLFRGLIDFSAGPNEVAGVLAHEFSHIEYGHPTELMVENGARAFLLGLLLGDVFGGSAVVGIANAALQARYSRSAEQAADNRAVQLLDGAGYDIGPFGKFFERMASTQDKNGAAMPFLNSHPASAERAKIIAAASGKLGEDALDAEGWKALKAICD